MSKSVEVPCWGGPKDGEYAVCVVKSLPPQFGEYALYHTADGPIYVYEPMMKAKVPLFVDEDDA